MTCLRLTALVAALAVLIELPLKAQTPPALGNVLQAAGAYVAQYQQAISVVVAEEDYQQTSTTGRSVSFRHLQSDLMVLNAPSGWIGFRDVFEVDGRPVRDRQERLGALFTKAGTDGIAQAEQIALEGARFNLNQELVDRTINVPMTALRFLDPANQRRSRFRIDGHERVGAVDCAIIRFTEQATPRLLLTDNGAAAAGAFWIEPQSGRVQRSELTLSTDKLIANQAIDLEVTAKIRVNYAEESQLGLWLPVSMDEHYDVSPQRTSIDGHATYSHFRQFQVQTETGIALP